VTVERQVAIVAYQGVLADETHAFRAVLGRAPGAHLVTVGARRGVVAGPGGAHVVDATYDDVRHAAVVVVPGGLGSHRHPEIAAWTLAVRPEWVLTSSTGSALLAAAGLLRGRTAATHWLAGPLLERHGATVSAARVAVDAPYVTCAGLCSTYDAALHVVGRVWGPATVEHIRAELAAMPADEPLDPVPSFEPEPTGPIPKDRKPRHHPRAVVEVELEERVPRR
jgi:transcriptional regulator GlxA family with amidase domain